jgi:hypothetical protein
MPEMFPVVIPDALIEWGRSPEVEVHFPRPWALQVVELAKRGADIALTRAETDVLLARLEALCGEALRAGRGDLLLGFDTWTADLLNLVIAFESSEGRKIEIGRGKRYSWPEFRAILAADDPDIAVEAAETVKNLLGDIFPGIRMGSIDTAPLKAPLACATCGATGSRVMMTTSADTRYCGPCWTLLTDNKPLNLKKTKR